MDKIFIIIIINNYTFIGNGQWVQFLLWQFTQIRGDIIINNSDKYNQVKEARKHR